MRKYWQIWIALALATFLFVIAFPLTYAHREYPITLGHETLFNIQQQAQRDSIKEQARNLSNCLQKNAQNLEIKTDSLRIQSSANKKDFQWNDCKLEFILSDKNVRQNNIELEDKIKSAINKYRITVFLDDQPIFIVPSSVNESYTQEKRAQLITNRIKRIADDPSIGLKNLNVEEWNGGITNIVWGHEVLFTITDKDVKAVKVEINNKQKLAKLYLQRIKNAIKNYRNRYHVFRNANRVISNRIIYTFLLMIAILLIFIGCIYLYRLLINKFPRKLQKAQFFLWNDSRSLLNFIGIVVEKAFLLIIFILIIRLIFIFFNITYEAFFIEKNFTTIDLEDLGDHVVELLQMIGLLLLLGTVALLIHWLSTSRLGIVVLPFEDLTGGKYDGKAISDLLVEELHRIHQIHKLTSKFEEEEDIKLQNINFAPLALGESLESHFVNIGTVGIGNSEFQVGRILLILRWLWPLGGIRKVISGSIQQHDSVTHVGRKNIAELSLVGRLADGNKVSAWKASSPSVNQMKSILDMVRELAYKLSLYLAPNIEAKSWKSFKCLTEAISSYYDYKLTGKIASLEEAEKTCHLALEYDNKYQKISDLFYMIAVAYFKETKKQKKAKQESFYQTIEKLFKIGIKINPNNEYLYHGLGNLYLEQNQKVQAKIAYEVSRKLKPDFPYPYNGLGIIYYLEEKYKPARKKYLRALKYKKNFWKAHFNLGILSIYSQQDNDFTIKGLNQAIKEFNKAIKIKSNAYCYAILGYTYFHLYLKNNQKNDQKNTYNSCHEIAFPFQHLTLKNKNKRLNKFLDSAVANQEIAISIGESEGDIINWMYWNYAVTLYAKYANDSNNAKQYLNKVKELLNKACDELKHSRFNSSCYNDELWLAIYGCILSSLDNSEDLNDKINHLEKVLRKAEAEDNKQRINIALKDIEVFEKLPNQPEEIDKIISLLQARCT